MQAKSMRILERKEVRNLDKNIRDQYGSDFSLEGMMVIEDEDKIWIVSSVADSIEMSKLNLNSIGMYLGKVRRGKINLSVEGSQLIGRNATKNIIELSEGAIESFMSGADVPTDKRSDAGNFVIVRSGDYILGSGVVTESGIHNSIPKSRRI